MVVVVVFAVALDTCCLYCWLYGDNTLKSCFGECLLVECVFKKGGDRLWDFSIPSKTQVDTGVANNVHGFN